MFRIFRHCYSDKARTKNESINAMNAKAAKYAKYRYSHIFLYVRARCNRDYRNDRNDPNER